MTVKFPGGTAHALPHDVRTALASDVKALAAWHTLTPLSRNEWICWIITVKKEQTRQDHLRRTLVELGEGVRRPCCWMGCIHRTDKKISPSIKGILAKRAKK